MSCLSLRRLSNPAMLFHFVQAVWEKFDRSLSGSIRLIQRKLILIDSNLRRHCLIRKILSSKCAFEGTELPRCPRVINRFPWRGNVRQPEALAESSRWLFLCSWGISFWKGSALLCRRWSHRKSRLFLPARRPQSHHICDPQLSASACLFLRCWYYTSQSSGNEINLLGVLEWRKKIGSRWDMFQSAFAAPEVWIPTHGTIRTQGYHDITNKPRDEGSVLGSERRGGCLAPAAGLVPKCHWDCWGRFCRIHFFYLRPTAKRQRAEGSPTLAGHSRDGERRAGWDRRPPLSWSQGVELHGSLPLLLIFTSHKILIGLI